MALPECEPTSARLCGGLADTASLDSAFEEVNVKAPAICACGYTLQDLASRELVDLERAANADEETDRVDVDALALGARGRSRGREAAARKAEFVQVNPER